jgi:2-oxoglutarate ferredoxin oxidoreductase subunit delta
MDETTPAIIEEGYDFACDVAREASLPIEMVVVGAGLVEGVNTHRFDAPVLVIDRRMTPPWADDSASLGWAGERERLRLMRGSWATRPRPLELHRRGLIVMPKVIVYEDRCKGCELCTRACPQHILAMSKDFNAKGYFYACVVEQPRCIGCRLCAITCPDVAIEVGVNGTQYNFFPYWRSAVGAQQTLRRALDCEEATMAKVLMKGNEAIGEAAVRAGCRFFFGYPITPQSEVPEYLSKRLPEIVRHSQS